MSSTPESTLPRRANPCVVTINNTRCVEPLRGTQFGNPCSVGMLIAFDGTGMPELKNNSTSGGISFSSSAPDIGWTSHNLRPNEVVQFFGNPVFFPANITLAQRYFVLSPHLTVNTFQISAT